MKPAVVWRPVQVKAVNPLLAGRHYLGPLKSARLAFAGLINGQIRGAMVWRTPTSRRLPSDGSWLELSRWCLTPDLGKNAGSQAHRAVTRLLLKDYPQVTSLVSYSDPSAGHTGALYRACNWQWAPTWLRLRPPPTGNGSWQEGKAQSVKDRWVFAVRSDEQRSELLTVGDPGAIRAFMARNDATMLRWAERSLAPDLVAAVRATS